MLHGMTLYMHNNIIGGTLDLYLYPNQQYVDMWVVGFIRMSHVLRHCTQHRNKELNSNILATPINANDYYSCVATSSY